MSIADALKVVRGNIVAALQQTTGKDGAAGGGRLPRLVAVSKTKPLEAILEAYKAGQRHFGENYVQELYDKANDGQVLSGCKDIRWHFIGHLQRNKVNKLLGVPNLHIVETIDSLKIAETINRVLLDKGDAERLNVFVQVNTSQESNKNGVNREEVVTLVRKIREELRHLKFAGLMTIGNIDHVTDDQSNPDFDKLVQCRDMLCTALDLPTESVELSMGMSSDYELAIKCGSTNVRVGSSIFGNRVYKK